MLSTFRASTHLSLEGVHSHQITMNASKREELRYKIGKRGAHAAHIQKNGPLLHTASQGIKVRERHQPHEVPSIIHFRVVNWHVSKPRSSAVPTKASLMEYVHP